MCIALTANMTCSFRACLAPYEYERIVAPIITVQCIKILIKSRAVLVHNVLIYNTIMIKWTNWKARHKARLLRHNTGRWSPCERCRWRTLCERPDHRGIWCWWPNPQSTTPLSTMHSYCIGFGIQASIDSRQHIKWSLGKVTDLWKVSWFAYVVLAEAWS